MSESTSNGDNEEEVTMGDNIVEVVVFNNANSNNKLNTTELEEDDSDDDDNEAEEDDLEKTNIIDDELQEKFNRKGYMSCAPIFVPYSNDDDAIGIEEVYNDVGNITRGNPVGFDKEGAS